MNREYLMSLAKWGLYVLSLVLVAFGARWGIEVPPLPIPIRIDIQSPGGAAPPGVAPPRPGPTDPPTYQPTKAVGRLSVDGKGCSCTVVGQPNGSGQYLIFSAAHCVDKVGQVGKVRLGADSFTATVKSMDKGSDGAWLISDGRHGVLPSAKLAERSPAPGVAVWHQGYGVDDPGNREEGIVLSGENADGQLSFELSVSSGDSGGGIFRVDTGELVSSVCCTVGIGRRAPMYGCSVERAARIRPSLVFDWDWVPMPMPVVVR